MNDEPTTPPVDETTKPPRDDDELDDGGTCPCGDEDCS